MNVVGRCTRTRRRVQAQRLSVTVELSESLPRLQRLSFLHYERSEKLQPRGWEGPIVIAIDILY